MEVPPPPRGWQVLPPVGPVPSHNDYDKDNIDDTVVTMMLIMMMIMIMIVMMMMLNGDDW